MLIRALTEVALLALAGQAVLFLFAGSGRDGNPVYQLFRIVTRPVIRLTRRVSPRQVIDRHLPFAAFFLLFCAWVGLAFLKRAYCLANQLQCL